MLRYTKNSGSILIIVLWVSVILSILAIALAQQVSSELKITQVCQDRLKTLYLAKAAVERSIVELKRDSTPTYDGLNESWSNNPKIFKEVSLDDGRWTISYPYDKSGEILFYGMVDEERKININIASADIIRRLPDITDEIVNSIIDWRDADDTGEAEESYYQGLEQPYHCKNGPFEILEELLLVKGMTPEIFSNIRNLITIYGIGKVNINTAARETLLTFGLDESLIDEIINYRAGEDGQEGTEDDRVFTKVDFILTDLGLSSESSLASLIAGGKLTVESDNFCINAVGILDNSRVTKVITVVVNRDEDKIISWRED